MIDTCRDKAGREYGDKIAGGDKEKKRAGLGMVDSHFLFDNWKKWRENNPGGKIQKEQASEKE